MTKKSKSTCSKDSPVRVYKKTTMTEVWEFSESFALNAIRRALQDELSLAGDELMMIRFLGDIDPVTRLKGSAEITLDIIGDCEDDC